MNTRSVSIPLGFQNTTNNTQNHTMVPILDMLNHSSDADRVIASPRQVPSAPSPPSANASQPTSAGANGTTGMRTGPTNPRSAPTLPNRIVNGNSGAALVPGKIGLKLVAPSRGTKDGEEVMFTYGPHCSATLFAEYGFSELALSALPFGKSEAGAKTTEGRAWSRSSSRSSSSTAIAEMDGKAISAGTGLQPAEGEDADVYGGPDTSLRCNWRDLMNGQLDVGWLVDELWEARLSEEDREEREDALRVIGCFQYVYF